MARIKSATRISLRHYLVVASLKGDVAFWGGDMAHLTRSEGRPLSMTSFFKAKHVINMCAMICRICTWYRARNMSIRVALGKQMRIRLQQKCIQFQKWKPKTPHHLKRWTFINLPVQTRNARSLQETTIYNYNGLYMFPWNHPSLSL